MMMAAIGVTAAAALTTAAEKPKHPVRPAAAVKSPRDVATGQASGVVKAGGGGQVSAQKVDGWGVVKGVGNILSGSVKVIKGNVDAGVDQVKHGGEQIKDSTDKDDANNPSNQTGGKKK